MRWTPLSVSTMLLSSPTLRPKAASSNGFCIWPRWKKPRSPPARAEEQSLLAKHPEKSKVSVVRAPMLRGERHLRVHTGERGKVVLGGILLELLLKLLELSIASSLERVMLAYARCRSQQWLALHIARC